MANEVYYAKQAARAEMVQAIINDMLMAQRQAELMAQDDDIMVREDVIKARDKISHLITHYNIECTS